MRRLNTKGFSHHAVLAVILVVFAVGGVYMLISSRAYTPGDGSTAANPYSCGTAPSNRPTLKTGSTGTCVKYLQWQLNHPQNGTSYGVTIDGKFGSQTTGVVKNFQTQQGLTADGIVGPRTWQELYFSRPYSGIRFEYYDSAYARVYMKAPRYVPPAYYNSMVSRGFGLGAEVYVDSATGETVSNIAENHHITSGEKHFIGYLWFGKQVKFKFAVYNEKGAYYMYSVPSQTVAVPRY